MKLRRKRVEAPVYYFLRGDLPDIDFFSSQSCVRVVE